MLRSLCSTLFALALSSCTLSAQDTSLPDYVVAEFGVPPAIPEGPLPSDLRQALDTVVATALDQQVWNPADRNAFDRVAAAQDPRVLWTVADMQRFAWRPEFRAALSRTVAGTLGTSFSSARQREVMVNKLMAWDMPAYPGYLDDKRALYTNFLSGLRDIMQPGDIDWHLVDWGGVRIDARPYDTTDDVCHCIPAADNPEVEPAAQASWLKDDDIIFGVVVNGEARAYPRRIMEVREMVNDTLGGRDITMPYCTLCGAAQAYYTDRLPNGVKRPILRTSGLLIRSNKLMYDIETGSVFDTFLGKAVTGPLADIGLDLEKVTVITSDWGSWRSAYPDTTVLIEDLALGRDFNLRETRDANGPIFPVGDVDPRLSVHEDVVGVIAPDGTPIAFPRALSVAALSAGQEVSFGTVSLQSNAGGLVAVGPQGQALASHEAFWFAWSQFHPRTALWDG